MKIESYSLLPIVWIVVAILGLLGVVGWADKQDAQDQQAHYCQMVADGLWPDYDGIYETACSEKEGYPKLPKTPMRESPE